MDEMRDKTIRHTAAPYLHHLNGQQPAKRTPLKIKYMNKPLIIFLLITFRFVTFYGLYHHLLAPPDLVPQEMPAIVHHDSPPPPPPAEQNTEQRHEEVHEEKDEEPEEYEEEKYNSGWHEEQTTEEMYERTINNYPT